MPSLFSVMNGVSSFIRAAAGGMSPQGGRETGLQGTAHGGAAEKYTRFVWQEGNRGRIRWKEVFQ